MSKKSNSKRRVWFFCMTYASPNEFDLALSKASRWAYIFHDKDNNEPHYHVLLNFDNARTSTAVLRDFKSSQNTFVEHATDPVTCYEYLTHVNDPDKFQYDSSLIISHNPVYWEHFIPSIRDRDDFDFIDDLLNFDSLDIVFMAKKYGRDFIKNFKSYMEFRQEVLIRDRFR